MGAIFAKLDSDNTVTEIVSEDKNITKSELKKIKDLYNKYGVMKVTVDSDKLDKFIFDYVKKLLKSNTKIEMNLRNIYKEIYNKGTVFISMYGLALISNEGQINKLIEGYDNIENFADVSSNETSTPEVQKIKETPNIPTKVDIIIPKIYLTSERRTMFETIFEVIHGKKTFDDNDKLVLKNLDILMEGLNKGNNPQVKMANLVGLVFRFSVMYHVIELSKSLGENVFSKSDMLEYVSIAFSDLISDLPADKCTFYNENMDFIKFYPNPCEANLVDNIAILKSTGNNKKSTRSYLSYSIVLLMIVLLGFVLWNNRNRIGDISNLGKLSLLK